MNEQENKTAVKKDDFIECVNNRPIHKVIKMVLITNLFTKKNLSTLAKSSSSLSISIKVFSNLGEIS
jgi:hypothetical protein